MGVAERIWLAVAVYAAAGLLFGAWFVWAGVRKLDSQAVGTGVGFRLVILPGVVALWPVVIWKWRAARRAA
jgi:hypothetical protein